MGSLRDDYDLVDDGPVRAAVLRAWRDRIGPVRPFFESFTDRPADADARMGQGETGMREVCGAAMYCKVYRPGRLSRRLRDLAGRHRALLEWQATCDAADAGIIPATLVFAATRRAGMASVHLVLTLPAPGECVLDLLRANRANPEFQLAVLRQAAPRVAEWHAAGFHHAHLTTRHLYLHDGGKMAGIDFESSRVVRPLPDRLRANNLRQIHESLAKYIDDRAVFESFQRLYDEARQAIEADQASI